MVSVAEAELVRSRCLSLSLATWNCSGASECLGGLPTLLALLAIAALCSSTISVAQQVLLHQQVPLHLFLQPSSFSV